MDEIAAANEKLWDELAKEGCGYTVPWYDLTQEVLLQYATGQLSTVPPQLAIIYPHSVLSGVAGKQVLCLASGGGQQSAVFGLLGAEVTVVELSQRQLDGDRLAAEHYGYAVTTLKADMRDLSLLGSDSFDMVYQGNSIGYVPDVREVFSGVARILRTGGIYRVDCQQPTVFSAEWDGKAYCIVKPYSEKTNFRKDGGIEYRHYLSDVFNGLIDAGFSIVRVHERPQAEQESSDLKPGSWSHQEAYVAGEYAVVARRV